MNNILISFSDQFMHLDANQSGVGEGGESKREQSLTLLDFGKN